MQKTRNGYIGDIFNDTWGAINRLDGWMCEPMDIPMDDIQNLFAKRSRLYEE